MAWGVMSLPTRERELKLGDALLADLADGSLPTRERELKRASVISPVKGWRSLPTRERELKPPARGADRDHASRSPRGSVN